MIVEFLLEEPSMVNYLEQILPKILPEGFVLNENCFLRPHNGKSDLLKSIPQKVKAFSKLTHEAYRIVIVHDQDSNDCKHLKQKLATLCIQNGDCPTLIRIACRELEAWYLGDMDAIQKVYPSFKADQHRNKAKFRDPDTCNPSEELKKLIPNFQKGYASKEISKYISIENNRSASFGHFVSGLKRFLSSDVLH